MNTLNIIFLLLISISAGISKEIPYDRVLSAEEVLSYLNEDLPELAHIIKLRDDNREAEAITQFTKHLKDKIGERFYFDWSNFRILFRVP